MEVFLVLGGLTGCGMLGLGGGDSKQLILLLKLGSRTLEATEARLTQPTPFA